MLLSIANLPLMFIATSIVVGGHPHMGDVGDVDCPLDVVGFGSCSNPKFPQPLWDKVMAWGPPELWLWTGDAVYPQSKPTLLQTLFPFWHETQHNTTAVLEEAFQRQAASEEYTAFKATGVHIEVTTAVPAYEWVSTGKATVEVVYGRCNTDSSVNVKCDKSSVEHKVFIAPKNGYGKLMQLKIANSGIHHSGIEADVAGARGYEATLNADGTIAAVAGYLD
eukprot:gene8535-11415_t